MVWRKQHRNTISKGLVILLLMIQSSLLFGQQDLTQNRAVVGRDLTLSIQTEQPYSGDLRASIGDLPESVRVTYGPVIRAYRKEWITEGRKEVQSLAEVRLIVRASEPGIFRLENLQLNREGFIMELDPVYFLAFQWDEINNTYPQVIEWKNTMERIYQGQAVPLMLESIYTESILFADSIQFSNPPGTILEKSSLPGEIETIPLDETHLVYRYPLESWIFTALNVGTVNLRGGEVQINGLRRSIPPLSFEVLPLPEEVQSNTAVGSFSREVKVNQEQLQLGDALEVTLIIQGQGNLTSLRVEDPLLEGWDIISRREELEVEPDNRWGYRGSRKIVYRLHSLESRNYTIEFPPYFYWNPFEERTIILEPLKKSVTVESESIDQTIHKFELISPLSVLKNQDWFHLQNPRVYLFLIPMGLLFFGAAIYKRIRWGSLSVVLLVFLVSSSAPMQQEELSRLKQAEEAYNQENYSEALALYQKLEPVLGFNSFYFYNKGLIQWKSGIQGRSQWSMRMALTGKPGYPLFMHALQEMNRDQNLDEQYLGALSFRQSILLIVFLITAFLFFLSLGLHVYFNQTRTLLILCVFLSLWVLSSGSMVYLFFKGRTEQAVVIRNEVPIRKIQGEYAREWISLEEGTTLEILAEHDLYLFVRTGFGLKGWVESRDISRLYYGEKP